MKDLTQGSITRALVAMAVPIAIGMLFQTLYLLVDLYFVARLGDAAIAGVSSAGTAGFVILALTQMLGVGTVALVSHAVGRKDQAEANLVFNQSVLLSAICGGLTLAAGFLVGGAYVRSVAADPAAAAAGVAYLYWYTPGLALQFALVAMGSALRGTGIVQPTMIVQMLTVILNTVLAPVLIAGWGTHHPLGAAGAGLASSIAVAFGVAFLWIYFLRLEHYVGLRPELFIEGFTRQPDAVAVGSTYLRVISWNFLATGLIFTCSGLFQALGNTWPSLLSSGARLLTFVLPAVWLSTLPHFSLMQVWYLSVASVTMQALTSLALLQRELRRRLAAPPAATGGVPAEAVPVGEGADG